MFFNSRKRQIAKVKEIFKESIIDISRRIVEEEDSQINFKELDNYQNLLLRLFVHSEAMMLSGGEKYVNSVAHCVGGHVLKHGMVGSVKEFVEETGDIFNAIHPVFEKDMRMENGIPVTFYHTFVEKVAYEQKPPSIEIFQITVEMKMVMKSFVELCGQYRKLFDDVHKRMS